MFKKPLWQTVWTQIRLLLITVHVHVLAAFYITDSILPASDMNLFASLGEEDNGGESFEKLFEQFGRMKGTLL